MLNSSHFMAIDSLLKKPVRIYFVCTGGGAGLQEILWSTPGISSVLAGAEFPYSTEAQDRFLGFKPTRYVNERIAVAMAMESYYRAYVPGGPKAIGVALTAVVATGKAHKGNHRIHVAWFSDHGCKVINHTLEKSSGALARIQDGNRCNLAGLEAILDASGVGDPSYFQDAEVKDGTALAEEIFFERPYFSTSGKRLTLEEANVEALFPGAFNPPHEGHFGMAEVFRRLSGYTPTFAITASAPHKPALTVADMLQRAKMLEGFNRMFTLGDPLYLDKAKRYPGTPIIIGTDALQRMLDPKWGVDPEELGKQFERLGTTFYATERSLGGSTTRVEDLDLPKGFSVQVLPGRWNISSSELRQISVPASPSSQP